MSITSPADLAAIRPVDIRDQAHFCELLACIPRPVPQEWKIQFGRMNAIARRHGYAWPYVNRINDPKTTGKPQLAPLVPGTTAPYRGGVVEIEPRTESQWHVAYRDGWEYFEVDSYPYRAPIDSPIDPEEHYRKIGIEEACAYADWPALYKELTGKELYG